MVLGPSPGEAGEDGEAEVGGEAGPEEGSSQVTVTYTRRSEQSQHSPKGDRTQKRQEENYPSARLGWMEPERGKRGCGREAWMGCL